MTSVCVHLCVVLLWEIRQQGELPFISKEQKQSAAPAGSCILSSSFHFLPTLPPPARTHILIHTHTTYTSKHPMTFHAYSHKQIDNSPESLKASNVWAIKHTHRHTYIFLDLIFKEGLRHRRQGAEGGEEPQTQCSSHTRANPIPWICTPT